MNLVPAQKNMGIVPFTMTTELESDVRERVKRLRLAMQLPTQQSMADHLGIEFNRWNNVERGLPLGHDLAVKLCQKFPGVTLDWLYFGKPDGLPLELARRLGEVPESESTATLSRRRKR